MRSRRSAFWDRYCRLLARGRLSYLAIRVSRVKAERAGE